MGDDPIMQSELTARFGAPEVSEKKYCKIIDLTEFKPYLGHVKDWQGNPWKCKIYGHKLLEEPLVRVFRVLCGQGTIKELKTFDGCFNIRKMKGSINYSVHSWGLALDFNAAQNPYGGQVSFSDGFIRAFAINGFESGGLWQVKDGMHFQLPWTRDWRQVDREQYPLAPMLASWENPVAPAPPAPPKVEAKSMLSPEIVEALKKRWPIFKLVGEWHQWDPVLLAAMDIRESHCGLLLDESGLGDGGHGHGEMQIDDRSFPNLCNAELPWWHDPLASIAIGSQALQQKFDYLLGRDNCPYASDSVELLWCAVAAYNKGEGRVRDNFPEMVGMKINDALFWEILDENSTANYASGVRDLYKAVAALGLG